MKKLMILAKTLWNLPDTLRMMDINNTGYTDCHTAQLADSIARLDKKISELESHFVNLEDADFDNRVNDLEHWRNDFERETYVTTDDLRYDKSEYDLADNDDLVNLRERVDELETLTEGLGDPLGEDDVTDLIDTQLTDYATTDDVHSWIDEAIADHRAEPYTDELKECLATADAVLAKFRELGEALATLAKAE